MVQSHGSSNLMVRFPLHRRHFMSLLAGGAAFAGDAWAGVPVPYAWNTSPPTEGRETFIAWMRANRGEEPVYLGRRWDRYKALLAHNDLWGARNIRGFLHT